jgi:hypothetical protein
VHVGGGAPDEARRHLGLAERPAELAEHLGLDADREALAVDEDTVAVEDHEGGVAERRSRVVHELRPTVVFAGWAPKVARCPRTPARKASRYASLPMR